MVQKQARSRKGIRAGKGQSGEKGDKMQLKDKTVIITGGAQGIGAAVARRFAIEGAQVVIGDLDGGKAADLAADIGGLGLQCDVTKEADIQRLVDETRARFGPVDLFYSNAGLGRWEPDHAASASNADWQLNWEVHVMSHVYAARAVLPGMIERGQGYLLQMSSAAGLLNQIGNAAYSATKHAAVGFAESLAISHAADGVRVSVICPQYVATPLLGYEPGEMPEDAPNVLSPEAVAEVILQGVQKEKFLILPHPEVAQFLQFKTADYDRWLATMVDLRGKIIGKLGNTRDIAMHKMI